jgi:hypothetical protein
MELNFAEVNNINTQNPYEELNYSGYTTEDKYWEQQQKKKKVSFDDILTNMNLVVNKSGVLQFMTPKQTNEEQYQNSQEQYQTPQKQCQVQEKLEPSVKHSYIFNKYFKDYHQDVIPSVPQVRVPKTMDEYKLMLLEDKIKQIEQRRKISELKSTKLMFTTNPSNYANSAHPRNIQTSKNNLKIMTFK